MMKRTAYTILAVAAGLLLSCAKEETPGIRPDQERLIGRAVNFNVSMAEDFVTKSSTYTSIDKGSFNQNDRMRVFRNYWGGNDWEEDVAYRTYYLMHNWATGSIKLKETWLPDSGRLGYDDIDGDGTFENFIQTSKDSLIWNNGRTIRFSAWSQSNYSNTLRGATKDFFYPDFCIADWVNSSGPSEGIPLVLKHQGSRICFKVKDTGNDIFKVELCAGINHDGTERADGWKDYKFEDNSDSIENDDSEAEYGKSDELAKRQCDSVTTVYKRMCMPAGVDIISHTLLAVKNSWWNALTDSDDDKNKVRNLEEQDPEIFIKYGSNTSEVESAKRPFFCKINGYHYLITIPYDMENGNVFILPPCTRFRVYMYDINGGDEYDTGGYEGTYHIFALRDIVEEKNGKLVKSFAKGMKMEKGVSYTFRVGYRYGKLYVVADKSLSWEKEPEVGADGKDEAVDRPVSTTVDYTWWKRAISESCESAGTRDYKPEFKISNEKEFLEFVNLVNGTAATKTDGLYRLVKRYKETIVNGQTIKEPAEYGWSTRNSQYNPVWIEEAEAEAMGYLFYDHYHPANADKAAYSDRDYIRGPFPFYDDNLRINFKVNLMADLDLKDWSITSIGDKASNPFMGKFDGNGHIVRNINLKDEYLFGHINGKSSDGASVTNLRIESSHKTALLNTGINPIFIAGISIAAPSGTNSIARSMSINNGVKGYSYVVGCIHVGDASGALVGTASNLYMFGCMQAAQGIKGGALIGTDANNPKVFKPQISISSQIASGDCSAKPQFKNFMCNFYDVTLSPSAKAVGTVVDDYSLLEYIRGHSTEIMMAKNPYLTRMVPMDILLKRGDYKSFYGLAPWQAMNYAINWYNNNGGSKHQCKMHYESYETFRHRYPSLTYGSPSDEEVNMWNPIIQPN